MSRATSASARFDVVVKKTENQSSEGWQIHRNGTELAVTFSHLHLESTQKVNLTRWRSIGAIADELAENYARAVYKRSPTQRFAIASGVTSGICLYAEQIGLRIESSEDIPENLPVAFLKHLNTRLKPDGTPLTPWTRLNYWRTFMQAFGPSLMRRDVHVPANPFAGVPFTANPSQVDHAALAELVGAAAADARKTMALVGPHLSGIRKASQALDAGQRPDFSRAADLAAFLMARYGGVIPTRTALIEEGSELLPAISAHGYLNVRTIAHPYQTDLLPFFVLLAVHSGFNQQPLADLALGGVGRATLLGTQLTTISSKKNRSNTIVRRAFAETSGELAPGRILRFVTAWTKALRAFAPDSVSRDLWLFAKMVNKKNSGQVASIDSLAFRHSNTTVSPTKVIVEYCAKRKLKFVGLRENRRAFAEMVYNISEGDFDAMRVLLGHSTERSLGPYKTEPVVAAERERLAGAMATHQRWIGSRGKIDIRVEAEKRDRSAATPGFLCADPFNSPIPTESRGRLCGAYGKCPACPLAALDSDRPYALARLLQLQERYEAAQAKMGPAVWTAKFGESARLVRDRWIPSISTPNIPEQASTLLLPPLPELE